MLLDECSRGSKHLQKMLEKSEYQKTSNIYQHAKIFQNAQQMNKIISRHHQQANTIIQDHLSHVHQLLP